jgi:hypothetical protein
MPPPPIPQSKATALRRFSRFLYVLVFGNRMVDRRLYVYTIVQIVLFITMFIFNQGYFTVISRFMLTYLTLGPAKISVDSFVAIQTLFWSFFILGRFGAAYLAYKIDPIKFFVSILVINLAFVSLFLIPALTRSTVFFWIGVSLIGLSSGPITPTGLMIAKQMLEFSSFVLSLFIVGLAFGGIVFQQITGSLLDYYQPSPNDWFGFTDANSSYIIPYLAWLPSAACLLAFVPIYILFVRFDFLTRK